MLAFRLALLPVLALCAAACSTPAEPASSTGSGGSPGGGAGGSTSNGGGTAAGGAPAGGSGGATGGQAGGGQTSAGGAAGTGGTAGGGGVASAGASGSGGAPPEGVPEGYTLQFEESFATPESLAKLVFANPDDWAHVAEGGGYLESTGFSYTPPTYSPRSVALLAGAMFGSFVLEVEIWQTSMTGGHRDNCIFWGMTSPSSFYYAHIGQMHDGASHNIHIVNESDRTPITETFDDGFDWGMDWQLIRVVRDAQTGSMAVYGNGAAEPMLTATDTTLGEGYIGFGAFDDTGRVRNVKIWAPSATLQSAGFFTAK